MKTTITLRTIIAGVVLAGCSTTPSHRDISGVAKAEIVATVTCSNPGTKFDGTIDSDGRLVRLGGTGRRTFRATGHEFVCLFQKDGSEGGISILVSEAGTNLGSSSIATPYGGVRAEIVRTAKEHRQTFTAIPDAR